MISVETNFSKWHHFSSVVLTPPSSPTTHDRVQFLSCISLKHLHEILEVVHDVSNLFAVTIKTLDWYCLIKSVCHIKSAWLLVTFQFSPHQSQLINVFLEILHHTISVHLFSATTAEIDLWIACIAIIKNFLVEITRCVSSERVVEFNHKNVFRISQLFGVFFPSKLRALTQTSHQARIGKWLA